ncbi:MAG: rhomboid family intramembrane serine protease [Planctomycetes bacterium]|nr:rhomboid family intramembrane serine protease [Planctomycetota bacterium]
MAILSAIVTVAWWSGKFDINKISMDILAWYGEPWRLATSILPHIDAMHLIFNLYWLWVFGTIVENVLGSVRMAGMLLFFAIGSSVAEYAVFDGGVGLSGVGYGLFGFLWAVQRKDYRFRDSLDNQTVILFVLWFFLCIILTETGVWNIGNIAHATGLALGGLLGHITVTKGRNRVVLSAIGIVLLVLIFLSGTFLRYIINRSDDSGNYIAYAGYEALEEGRNKQAVNLYLEAIKMDRNEYEWWYNLGIAYKRLGKTQESKEAFNRAKELEPIEPDLMDENEEGKTKEGERTM